MRVPPTALTIALLSTTLGCEVPPLDVPQTVASAPAETEEPQKKKLFGKEDWYLADGRVDMSGVAGEPAMTTAIPREVHPKDPKKGKLTRRRGGVLGTSLKALPWAENKIKFMMIHSEMEKYNAIKGDYPKSHKEFMEEYLPEYYPVALPLPELETGDEYIYDPEDHRLKIWRPEE